ncbi:MAG: alpha/beta hydrolase [Betaproteobacteria bacterium]
MTPPRCAPRSHIVDVRGIDYHVLEWGDAVAPPLVLLHGWMDVAASFQFMVDALSGRWRVIAPDWQGFGRTAWRREGYWFQDYVADLDFLLRALVPNDPANLVGHSLGANVAMIYAGVRASRVRSVVALDGFGIPAEDSSQAPAKLAAWLDALAHPPVLAPYPNLAAVADRLQKNNPRLPRDKAEFLAAEWAEALPAGGARLRADPRHKLPFPTVYRMDDIEAIWREVRVPVLWVGADDSKIPHWLAGGGDARAEIARRMRNVPQATFVSVADAGHMLHHDQPRAVAGIVERFIGGVITAA